jgi:hypothetical protein
MNIDEALKIKANLDLYESKTKIKIKSNKIDEEIYRFNM